MESMGSWLKAVRLSKGCTQLELAKKLKMTTPQGIGNIERGAAPFPHHAILGMAEFLQVDPEIVLTRVVMDYEVRLRKKLGMEKSVSQ